MIENLLDKSKESSDSLINKLKQRKWSYEQAKPVDCISESTIASCSSSTGTKERNVCLNLKK